MAVEAFSAILGKLPVDGRSAGIYPLSENNRVWVSKLLVCVGAPRGQTV